MKSSADNSDTQGDLTTTVAYLLGTECEIADGLILALSPLVPVDRASLHVVTDLICEQVNSRSALGFEQELNASVLGSAG